MEDIQRIFKNRKTKPILELKRSAVVIPILEDNGKLKVLFEVRSSKLKSQPLDICLPGGKIEGNESYKETAERELMEELLIGKEAFNIIGEMDYFVTPYRSVIYPFVAKIDDYKFTYNKDEVEKVFMVPLDFFQVHTPLKYELKISPVLQEDFPYELINGGRNYPFASAIMPQYFYKFENHVIWGATAIIIKAFTDIINES